MDYEIAYKEALNRAKLLKYNPKKVLLESENIPVSDYIFPELKESEDERIRKSIIGFLNTISSLKDGKTVSNEDFDSKTILEWVAWLEKQGERELVNFDEAEKEKSDFVGGGFLKCFRNFLDFKKFETYWLEYIGDDNYNVRSDNLLGKTYHITPYQLYTIFRKQTGFKKQGESAEINPDEIIEECHQDNANHIIDIVTEQRKPAEWSDPYNGVSFVYNNHTWGMCARDGGIDILCDSKLIKHIEQGKTIFEKLSEQMPTDKIQLGKEYKCIASPRYTMFLTGDIYKPEDGFLCSLMNLCSDCFELVEDSEQNVLHPNIDKLEPKFKVGDWIITPENKVLQITSIEDTSYKFNNESHYWEVYYCDKQCRLWSIADAKDGDVLMSEDDYPFIYADKHIYTKYLTAYCGITNDGVFKISDKTELWTNDNVEPASKEQRNMLFSKMKEAGYMWDSEKKELIKIEQV